VALTPAGAQELVLRGHRVLVERGAGEGVGIRDEDYIARGAKIADKTTIFQEAEIVIKVKEPILDEPELLREGQILFTYLHLAPEPTLTRRLLAQKVTAIGYETVEEADGSLPLLIPMSIISGRLAPQVGAFYLESQRGGRGILLGGSPGVSPAHVVILGGGTVGTNAARVALGIGAKVTMLLRNQARMRYLDEHFGGRVITLPSNTVTIGETVATADVLIGAVLETGAKAPKLVTREMIQAMKPGSVIVDVSIDQGGCIETSRPTTHSDPVYVVEGVIHYCVSNMPAAVASTATLALTNATLPYIIALADKGLMGALRSLPALAKGLNLHKGMVTCQPVAESLGLPYTTLEEIS